MLLHGYWTNGAVIQQNSPYHITGWERAAGCVTAVLRQQSNGAEICRSEALVQDGFFSIEMPPMAGALTGYLLEITGSCQCTLTDICFGEVWITAGQSNMAFALGDTLDRHQADDKYSEWIRYFRCEKPEDATAPTTTHRETIPQSQQKQSNKILFSVNTTIHPIRVAIHRFLISFHRFFIHNNFLSI